MTMNSDDFWERRESDIKATITRLIINYCDVYDILHSEVFNAESVKTELTKIIDYAIKSFISDNYY